MVRFHFLRIQILIYLVSVKPEPILRQDYGVIFTPHSVINTATSNFHHTFVVSLNTKDLPFRDEDLCANHTLDNRLNESYHADAFCCAYGAYRDRAVRLKAEIQSLQRTVDLLLPTHRQIRRKRGLVDAVGEASNFLFGTAREKDVKKLSKQIRDFRNFEIGNIASINNKLDDLTSISMHLTSRQDAIFKAVQQSRQSMYRELYSVRRTLGNDIISLKKWISILHLYNSHVMQTLEDIRLALQSEVSAISTLVRGYLPIELVPPATLQHFLNNLASRLDSTVFRIVHPDAPAYYHIRDILYQRDSKYLYITLKVPIATLQTQFTAYRIRSFPILMDTSPASYSTVQLSPYLGLSTDNRFYLLLNEDEYALCEGNALRRCLHGYSIRSTSQKSCELALFKNNQDDIHNLCKFEIFYDTPPTSILPLQDGSFFISSTSTNWMEYCATSPPRKIEPCSLCVVRVPCSCSLISDSFYLPTPFEDCVNDTTTKITPGYNFPALMHFYADKKQFERVISNARNRSATLQFSSFKIKNRKFDQVLDKVKKEGFLLNMSMKTLRSRKPVYFDKASALADSLGYLSRPSFSIGGSTFLIAVAFLAAGSFALAIRNMLLLSVLAKPAASESIWKNLQDDNHECFNMYWFYIVMVIIAIVIILLLIVGIVCVSTRSFNRSPDIFQNFQVSCFSVAFYGRSGCFKIPIRTVPLAFGDIFSHLENQVTLPHLSYGCLGCHLTFDWSYLNLKCKFDGKSIFLPKRITVKLFSALRFLQVIRELEFVQFLVTSGDIVTELGTWSADQLHTSSPAGLNERTIVNLPPVSV